MKSCFMYTSICIHICVYVHIKTHVNWVFLTMDYLYPKIHAIFSWISIFRVMSCKGSRSLWNKTSLCTLSWPHAAFLDSRNILLFYYLWQGLMDVRLASNLLWSLQRVIFNFNSSCLHFLGEELTDMRHRTQVMVCVVLGIKLLAYYMLGKHPANWAASPDSHPNASIWLNFTFNFEDPRFPVWLLLPGLADEVKRLQRLIINLSSIH